MLKLSDNPPMIPPSCEGVAGLSGQWLVAHTKARAEKALAWDLLHRGIGYYLPMVERVRFSGDRRRRVLLPLFPSYLFVCGNEDDRYTVLTTNRVCQIIKVTDTASLVSDLTNIEKALTASAELDPYPSVAIGHRYRIIAGPFAGLEGTVVRRTTKVRFVLQVNFISLGAAMEVDADLLEEI